MTSRVVAAAGALLLGTSFLAALPVAATASPSDRAGTTVAAPKVCIAGGCWVTAKIDVDGDGRRDSISSTRSGTGTAPTWTLRVLTAKGKLALTRFHPTNFGWEQAPGNVSFGAAALDGVKGSEVVIGGDSEDSRWFYVYTWRAGRLVPMPAPGGGLNWGVAHDSNGSSGFTFRTSGGRRTVLDSELNFGPDSRYSGTLTTYTWSKTTWKRSSTKKVSLTSAQALRYAGWNGTSLPKGMEGPPFYSCEPIIFTFGDDQAFDISTTNVTCSEATSFIKALDTKVDYQKPSVSYASYFCAITLHHVVEGMDWAEVECIKGTRFIRFARV